MQGDKKVIQHLNTCLGNELIAINQYFLHARMFKNWGLDELNEHEYKKSIKDMKQADRLIERILFLEGIPNLQKLGKIMIGEDTKEMLSCDLKLETTSIKALQEAIIYCESASDYVSRDILRKILAEEEDYLDWLETQLSLIEGISIENYMQSMIGS